MTFLLKEAVYTIYHCIRLMTASQKTDPLPFLISDDQTEPNTFLHARWPNLNPAHPDKSKL